ncbi:glycosyltransferase family 2 protein [Cytobacillus kochii]
MTSINRAHARELLNSNKISIVNYSNKLLSKFFKKQEKLITVITAAYNAEKSLEKTILSVVNQSLDSKHIEYIIVDDCSTDKTRNIALSYAEKHKNITVVTLSTNTGSPGTPRNIGLELSNSKYVTFLDSDDWFDTNGLENLLNILEETNDDYVVGKTIKVKDKSLSIIGEYASVMERRSISPFDIPHFFYHMGPTARMMKLSIINQNDIGFPDGKFGEDKQFFFDFLTECNNVSTTTKPIYYVNRMEENNQSLTKTTEILDKRKADLNVIEFLKQKKLPLEYEKIALNRIYEYDFMRIFESTEFLKAKDKTPFINILKEMYETTFNLEYNFIDNFENPLFKTAFKLYTDNRIGEFIQLFEWNKRDTNKKYLIKDGLPYYEVPFLEEPFNLIRIPMFSRALDSYIVNNKYHQTFEIYGDNLKNVQSILIRDRSNVENDLIVSIEWIDNNIGKFIVPLEDLKKMDNSLFTVFIRYNDYQIINIKRILHNQVTYQNKTIKFYSTIANNLGLSIKTK